MSSNRRHTASVNNGRKSRGPLTPEGKARSAMNALRHGLLAQNTIVGTESRENFDLLVKQHLDRFGPLDGVEFTMLEDMISANWRLQRGRAIEKTWLNQTIAAGPKADGMTQITLAYATLSATDKYKLFQRYETRLYNMYQRSLKTLLLLRQFDNNDYGDTGNPEPAPKLASLDCQTNPVPEANTIQSQPEPLPTPPGPGAVQPPVLPASPDCQTNLIPESNTIQSQLEPVAAPPSPVPPRPVDPEPAPIASTTPLPRAAAPPAALCSSPALPPSSIPSLPAAVRPPQSPSPHNIGTPDPPSCGNLWALPHESRRLEDVHSTME